MLNKRRARFGGERSGCHASRLVLAHITAKSARGLMGKSHEDGVRNRQAAWAALPTKYNGNTKEARREFHDKLHTTIMQSGDDPEDFSLRRYGWFP